MSEEIHEHVRRRLAGTRNRYTSGRRDLVELLVDVSRPLTIDELRAEGARQSQSSLYRNLGVLERCDVVRRLPALDDVARFELAEELTEHHHHVVCERCGRLDDVVLPRELEDALTSAALAVQDQLGYDVDAHRVELVGTCAACRD